MVVLDTRVNVLGSVGMVDSTECISMKNGLVKKSLVCNVMLPLARTVNKVSPGTMFVNYKT